MKKILLTTILILLLPTWAGAATYTVTQSGGGADYSAAGFNALSGDYSDDVFYFSGIITTSISVSVDGTSGHPVILDGYQAGNYDPINTPGGTHAEISATCAIGGYAFKIDGGNYITIQDFEFDGNGTVYDPVLVIGGSTNIIFKRCHFHDAILRALLVTYTGGACSYITVGGASGDGCSFEDIGVGIDEGNPLWPASASLEMTGTYDMVVSYNKFFYSGTGDFGSTGIQFEDGARLLVEYNESYGHYDEGGIATKHTHDAIIRFNHVHNCGDYGIGLMFDDELNAGNNNYIYGNKVYDNGSYGMMMMAGAENSHWWSNIVFGNDDTGLCISSYNGGNTDIYVYNNTFVDNADGQNEEPEAGFDSGGIYISGTHYGDRLIRNNIFYGNYGTSVYGGGAWTVSDNYTTDPSFTNPAGYDYTLLGSSPCIDNGADLSGLAGSITVQGTTYNMYYDDGLDPNNTDFSTFPPTVSTLKQDDYGVVWEQGAYVYQSGEEDPPIGDNDFSLDTDCFALYNFETGALTTDSKESETLTSNGDPAANGTNYHQGLYSVTLDGDDYYTRANAVLAAGYPLKSDDAQKIISVSAWVRPTTLTDDADHPIYAKYAGPAINKRSFFAEIYDTTVGAGTTFRATLNLGFNSGTEYEAVSHTTDLSINTWYHITFSYQDSDKAYAIRVRDTDGAVVGTDLTGIATLDANKLSVADEEVCIGTEGTQTLFFIGQIDEVVVFDKFLTAANATDIALGEYGEPQASPQSMSSSANMTSAGTHRLTLAYNREIYVEGGSPSYAVTYDYPVGTVTYYYAGKSTLNTYWDATVLAGYRQDAFTNGVISDDITLNGATIRDGQDADSLTTGALADLDSYPAHTVAIPYPSTSPKEFDSTNTVAVVLAAGFYFLPDDFSKTTEANSIGNADMSDSDGTSGHPITLNGVGFSHVGNQIFGDYWTIKRIIHGSTVTLGIGNTYKYSLIPEGDILQVPENATGCTVSNVGIRGTLDLDEAVSVYNTWMTTLDPAGLAADEPVFFYNCGFIESEAVIEAKNALDDLTFTDCLFEITETAVFKDYAGADFNLIRGSAFCDVGYNTGLDTDLNGRPTPRGVHDIGPYEFRGTGLLNLILLLLQ